MSFSGEVERYRRACLEQMYFELSSMSVYNITFESRQAAQNRKDIKHIVALVRSGTVRRDGPDDWFIGVDIDLTRSVICDNSPGYTAALLASEELECYLLWSPDSRGSQGRITSFGCFSQVYMAISVLL